MKKEAYFIILILLILPVITFAYCEGYNVWGYAWSENIGWISFNSHNCDGTDGCDNAKVETTCSGVVYGVNIENDKELSGYAWSENIGWISFDTTDASYPSVKLNSSNELEGYARALSHGGGWDGWIRFNIGGIDWTEKGVSLNKTLTPQEFEGYVWGDDVVGWVSMNHSNASPPNSNYAVYTNFSDDDIPDAPDDLDADENGGNLCNSYAISLDWTSDVSTEPDYKAYIVVKRDGIVIDERGITGTQASIALNPPYDYTDDNNYCFKVAVTKDEYAVDITSVNDNSELNTNKWSNWSTEYCFDTFERYPRPIISMDPENPGPGEMTRLINNTVCYDRDGNDIGCDEDDNVLTWEWSFLCADCEGLEDEWIEYGYDDQDPPVEYVYTDRSPKVKFLQSEEYTITLEAREDENKFCSASMNTTPVDIQILDIDEDFIFYLNDGASIMNFAPFIMDILNNGIEHIGGLIFN